MESFELDRASTSSDSLKEELHHAKLEERKKLEGLEKKLLDLEKLVREYRESLQVKELAKEGLEKRLSATTAEKEDLEKRITLLTGTSTTSIA